jgi:GT2 family glycosyltransferase
MDLSIIIINWNSADYLRKCLASIYAQTQGIEFEVVVVDSGSFDGSGELVGREFPQVRFVQSKDNLGFAKANNLAFQHTSGDYLLFLNPDTEVIGSAIADLLAQGRALPWAGAVGCKLLNTDRSVQTSCIQSFPTITNQVLDSEALRNVFPRSSLWGVASLYSAEDQPSEAEAISGACILMKREVFEDVGLFSTDYFMYAEDIDLCYKAWQKGYANYYVPKASIIHHGDGSVSRAKTNFAAVMAVESISRFLKKHRGAVYAALYRGALLFAAAGRLALLTGKRLPRASACMHGDAASSYGKWKAIFRWGAGRERWILDYQ